MSASFEESGLGDCLTTRPDCGLAAEQFRQQFGSLTAIAPYLQFIPGLIGVFLGAPLVAREFEQGTHALVFTQSVTRLRWITVKLALVLGLAVVATAALCRLVSWWYEPLARLDSGRFTPEVFSHEGLVPVTYALFAVALGVAAGTIVRRSVAAMAITLSVFFAVRFPIEQWVRPHYLPPLHLTHSPATGFGTGNPDDWNLSSQFTNAAGHVVPMQDVAALCPPGTDTPRCLTAHGYRVLETFQPADRFWAFQAIEAGIFLLLSAALVALTILLLNGRGRPQPLRRPSSAEAPARTS